MQAGRPAGVLMVMRVADAGVLVVRDLMADAGVLVVRDLIDDGERHLHDVFVYNNLWTTTPARMLWHVCPRAGPSTLTVRLIADAGVLVVREMMGDHTCTTSTSAFTTI